MLGVDPSVARSLGHLLDQLMPHDGPVETAAGCPDRIAATVDHLRAGNRASRPAPVPEMSHSLAERVFGRGMRGMPGGREAGVSFAIVNAPRASARTAGTSRNSRKGWFRAGDPFGRLGPRGEE